MPDEVERPALLTGKREGGTVEEDVLQGVFTFARHFPTMMKDGWPTTWRRFCYGMRNLDREVALQKLFEFDVRTILRAKTEQEVREWVTQQRILAK